MTTGRSREKAFQRERMKMPYALLPWAAKLWCYGNPDDCDFTKRFSSLPDGVALDLDNRYQGWKMGMTAPIAIVPAECFELVDGLIVY